MPPALNLHAFICDLLDIAKAHKGCLSGFFERHMPSQVFVRQQIDMKAQLFLYFAFSLIRIKTMK
jgi:hypothetical protein